MDRYHVEIDGECEVVELTDVGGRVQAKVGDRSYDLESLSVGRDALSLRHETRSYYVHVAGAGQEFRVKIRGEQYRSKVLSDREWHFRNLGGAGGADGASAAELRAPMPGKVLEFKVAAGDAVEVGTPLVILEAMKMENELKASGPAVVAEVLVEPGQAVESDQLLLRFEVPEGSPA